MKSSLKILAKFLVCCALLFCVQACSLFSFKTTTHYRDSEGHFSSALLDSVDKKTSIAWLKSQFGEPLFTDEGPDGAAICTWRFVRQKLKNNQIFLVWRSKSLKEEPLYFHAVVQKGVVLKSWRDQFEKVDTHRIFSEIKLMDDMGVVKSARSAARTATPPSQIVSMVAQEKTGDDIKVNRNNTVQMHELEKGSSVEKSMETEPNENATSNLNADAGVVANAQLAADEPEEMDAKVETPVSEPSKITLPTIAPAPSAKEEGGDILYGL